ncbi:PQQ-binding-like beta-propeller repeat protein [Lignipirellula cremea]|uniref:Outer membrane biogenesis protein BamB n=1 Tax=Lignipirellula cremea TaxID=2528010 RepID=A0A518DVZ7_9BACT|nr:PQQ-binding-like beta-propeller repeat protein [Lignipirellula cremea]QDU96012.1 outer membrane biogenesis protein BamB [Lignipirellula cremea]
MPRLASFARLLLLLLLLPAASLRGQDVPSWNQWRGPNRDGIVPGDDWPDSLAETVLTRSWRVKLPPSYSGPVVSESSVFVTGTEDKKSEVVYAFDRQTGEELWKVSWPGAMTVPFFAASNGSWIRATPACDGESLFVAGMRDVLVSLNAKTGEEQWRIDFVEQLKTPLPAFGFASSPLLDGPFLYVQAGASFVKIDKKSGKILWRTLEEDGGMMASAFSSPILASVAGQRQVIVQTRQKLAGVDPDNGDVLWEQTVPSFRGMNILTPAPFNDGLFTSSYQNKSWLFRVNKTDDKLQVEEAWENNAQGYMSTPVIIDGHAYLHLQNQRFTCIDLATGKRTWTSQPFGKYCSLVAQQDRILALDERGKLLLLQANPQEFKLLEERTVSEEETWAHLAVSGDQVFVRELEGLSAFRWKRVE